MKKYAIGIHECIMTCVYKNKAIKTVLSFKIRTGPYAREASVRDYGLSEPHVEIKSAPQIV